MSEHYYTTKGEPCHAQIVKSGPRKGLTRSTTLADAKKLGLLPSSSAYLNMLGKPHLIDWQSREVLKIAAQSPPIGGEDETGWARSIIERFKDHQKEHVMGRGTVLHNEIEQYFTSQSGDIVSDHHDFIAPVIEIVEEMDSPVAHAEKVVVNPVRGYAGTADIILESGQIVDFKSKDFKGKTKVDPSFEHCMQLASYFVAHNGHNDFLPCYNIYFDRNVPGVTFVKEWSPDELLLGWEAFLACTTLYRITKGYDARQ